MEAETRKCLKCRKEFTPKHEFNFLCKGCNTTNKTIRNYLQRNTGRLITKKELGDV